MTEKLYEKDAYLQVFTAKVQSCEPCKGGFSVILNRTAFFPEGGGQPCDTGILGGARVLAVHFAPDGETILHTTDAALPAGDEVTGQLDWARRLDAMQQHTGEHILSGCLHRLFCAENVGFHIGEPYVRMDTSIPLSPEQLAQAEAAANDAVRADTPVKCWVPGAAALAGIEYRSKKELTGEVRLVEAGGDVCACCGTHLARTGEVGFIKIISSQHYKTGMRLSVACGRRAYDAVAAAWADAEKAGHAMSVAVGALSPAVERMQSGETTHKAKVAQLVECIGRLAGAHGTPGEPVTEWIDGASSDELRRIATAAACHTTAHCGVFSAGGKGTLYVLAARQGGDVRPACKALNEKFGGVGGGTAALCQGSLSADGSDPEAFLRSFWAEENG